MIVTVTANTAIDHVVLVPKMELGTTVRGSGVIESMGGKPTDVSWILGGMGISSLALGFVAGQVGHKIEGMLRERGVETDFTWTRGESRRNIVIAPQDGSEQTTVTVPSLEVDTEHIEALKKRYEAALENASCVVLGGSLPGGMPLSFYPELIGMARAKNIPVIFDASEPHLSAGLVACPSYIKPNRLELEALFKRSLNALADVYQAGREILERYGTSPIISLGEQGGLAVLPDRTYRIPPINVEVKSSAGAGDGILSGLTAAIARDNSVEDGLRLGFAIATAVLKQYGTAMYDIADVEAFKKQIELIPWEEHN
jgi:1-phosphofructokinase family hexose kinase